MGPSERSQQGRLIAVAVGIIVGLASLHVAAVAWYDYIDPFPPIEADLLR